MRGFRPTLLALVLLGAALVTGAASGAATADVSTNWAGYVASPLTQADGTPGTFTDVSGTWVQPAATCDGTGTASSSAFWVGLGGNSDASNALEQIGTESDCTATGLARYSAWYELVPAPSVTIRLKISAGDRLSAAVNVNGTRVTLSLKNLTRGTSFSKVATMAAPDTSSVEWIAEAPSLCSANNNCRQIPLTNFGKVRFSHALATSNGHKGTVSDPAWIAAPIELASFSGGPGFGRYQPQAPATQALPSALSSRGATFTVTWAGQDTTTYDPGYPAYSYGG